MLSDGSLDKLVSNGVFILRQEINTQHHVQLRWKAGQISAELTADSISNNVKAADVFT